MITATYNPNETKTLPKQCLTLICDVESADGKHQVCYAEIPTKTVDTNQLRNAIALEGSSKEAISAILYPVKILYFCLTRTDATALIEILTYSFFL